MKSYKNYLLGGGGLVRRLTNRSWRSRSRRLGMLLLAGKLALAIVFPPPFAGWRTSAQSLSCDITQITNTTGGNSFRTSVSAPPSISGDGTRIAFEYDRDLTGGNPEGRDEIFLYDSTTGGFTQVTDVVGSNVNPSLSGDGTRIAFFSAADLMGGNADRNFEIVRYDVGSGSFTQITDTTGDTFAVGLAVSLNRDGTRLGFQSNRNLTGGNADGNFETFLYDSTTGGFTQVTDTTGLGGNGVPSLSGDGTRLAFVSDHNLTGRNADANVEIFLYDTQTGDFTQVTDTPNTAAGFNGGRSLSGDGTHLAFVSNHNLTGGNADGNAEIFLYDSTGGIAQVTDTTGGGLTAPSLNGDGTRLAFGSNHNLTGGNADGNLETFLYDVGSGSFTQVTDTTGNSGGFGYGVSLNGDGTRLVIASTRDMTGGNPDGNVEIFLATCPRDSDDDGIPDDSDPDTVADVINTLPDTHFHSLGNKNAFLSRLEAIEQLILAGNRDQAVQELQSLRRRVDGCGSAADSNDWINHCASQLQVRALIDMLITNLSL